MKKATLIFTLLFWSPVGFGQIDVLTYHYDNARTGQNIHETILTPTSIKAGYFGKLFSQVVDGDVYAQPLYVHDVSMKNRTHNIVFVATEANSVYAFDADDYNGGNYLWKANLLDQSHGAPAGATTIKSGPEWTRPTGSYPLRKPPQDIACPAIDPVIGITGTPVIDRSANTMYVDANSKEPGPTLGSSPNFFHRLHALDIITGKEKPGWPIAITGTVNGVKFDAHYQNGRSGLLLVNDTIYVAYGSHCDEGSYHGWIFAYDVTATTPSLKAVFTTTPHSNINHDGAGIWMEGAGLAADANGNLFVATGNGLFDTALNAQGFPISNNYGNSIVKLDPALHVLDYFTPFNQDKMLEYNCDLDLGSGGVLLLPDQSGTHPHMLVQAGKEGTVYLIDREQMTTSNQHYCATCTANTYIVQELPNAIGVMGVPAYWNQNVYFRGTELAPLVCPGSWSGHDYVLKAFSLNSGKLTTTPVQSSDDDYAGNVTISANNNTNGIVWALRTDVKDGYAHEAAVLKAYDAVSLALLFSSDWKGGPTWLADHDRLGPSLRFTTPVVANGKVYVGTGSDVQIFPFGTAGQLSVFGLVPVTPPLEYVTISPPELPYKVRIETKCTESIARLCLHKEIIRTCIGGNCFDVPKGGTGPQCVVCGLGLSAAVGAIGVIVATFLMGRRKPGLVGGASR